MCRDVSSGLQRLTAPAAMEEISGGRRCLPESIGQLYSTLVAIDLRHSLQLPPFTQPYKRQTTVGTPVARALKHKAAAWLTPASGDMWTCRSLTQAAMMCSGTCQLPQLGKSRASLARASATLRHGLGSHSPRPTFKACKLHAPMARYAWQVGVPRHQVLSACKMHGHVQASQALQCYR